MESRSPICASTHLPAPNISIRLPLRRRHHRRLRPSRFPVKHLPQIRRSPMPRYRRLLRRLPASASHFRVKIRTPARQRRLLLQLPLLRQCPIPMACMMPAARATRPSQRRENPPPAALPVQTCLLSLQGLPIRVFPAIRLMPRPFRITRASLRLWSRRRRLTSARLRTSA